jgi:hypothetical protein
VADAVEVAQLRIGAELAVLSASYSAARVLRARRHCGTPMETADAFAGDDPVRAHRRGRCKPIPRHRRSWSALDQLGKEPGNGGHTPAPSEAHETSRPIRTPDGDGSGPGATRVLTMSNPNSPLGSRSTLDPRSASAETVRPAGNQPAHSD